MKKTGEHNYQFDKSKTNELFELIDDMDFNELANTYDDPRISDIPSTIFKYNNKSVTLRWSKKCP